MPSTMPTDLRMYDLVQFRNPDTKVAYFVSVTRVGRPVNPSGHGWVTGKPIKYEAAIDRLENGRSVQFKKITMSVQEDSGKIPLLYAQLFLKAQAFMKDMGYVVKDRRWK